MKKHLLLLIAFFPVFGIAQNNVGIGVANPDASALLELSSTQQGLLVPRLTTVQRLGIATPANGLMVYDTDSTCVFFYNGSTSVWRSLCGSGITGINYDCGIGTLTLSGTPQSFTSANKAWLLSGNTVGATGYFGSEDAADVRIVTNNSGVGAACNFHNLAQKMIVTKDGNVGISYDGVTSPTTPKNKLLIENGSIFTGPDIYGRVLLALPFDPAGTAILATSNTADTNNIAVLGVVQKNNAAGNIGLGAIVQGNNGTNKYLGNIGVVS